MKGADVAPVLRVKLEGALAALEARWRAAGGGTTLEQQYGWLAGTGDAEQVRVGAGGWVGGWVGACVDAAGWDWRRESLS